MVWFSWFCRHVRIFAAILCCFLLKIPSYLLVSSQETRSWFPTSLARQLARTVNLKGGHLMIGGGFKYFLFFSLIYMGKWSNFDEHIFQMGNNHQGWYENITFFRSLSFSNDEMLSEHSVEQCWNHPNGFCFKTLDSHGEHIWLVPLDWAGYFSHIRIHNDAIKPIFLRCPKEILGFAVSHETHFWMCLKQSEGFPKNPKKSSCLTPFWRFHQRIYFDRLGFEGRNCNVGNSLVKLLIPGGWLGDDVMWLDGTIRI